MFTYPLVVLFVAIEVAVALIFTLRLRSAAKPTPAVNICGIVAILVGAWLLFKSHLDYGWLGPLGFLSYIPRRIQFLRSQGLPLDFWERFNPAYYLGLFGACLVIAGGGIMRLRSWARQLLLWASGFYLVFYMIRLFTSSFKLPAGTPALYGGLYLLSIAFVLSLFSPAVKKQFSKPA